MMTKAIQQSVEFGALPEELPNDLVVLRSLEKKETT
jgi:hypothetical protein